MILFHCVNFFGTIFTSQLGRQGKMFRQWWLAVASALMVAGDSSFSNNQPVPQPVQIFSSFPQQRQQQPAISGQFYSANPYQQLLEHLFPGQFRLAPQTPVQQPTNFYPALPQFIQSAGQQPLVYNPNYVSQPQQYFGFQNIHPTQFLDDNHLRFEAPKEKPGFNRGHVEYHPQREQVQTYTNFRTSEYYKDFEDSDGLMSRAAVEARPVVAEAYTGASSAVNRVDYQDEETGFDRGNVEAYPANLREYRYEEDEPDKEDVDSNGYGSYGQAGFRQAVESRPIFTPLQDASEAYPMLVQANSRPFGHFSENVLHGDQRSINAYSVPRQDPYRSSEGVIDPRYKLVCYYESWSAFRHSPQDFSIDRIDPFACTHIMYSFAGLDPADYTITSLNPDYDVIAGGYKSIVSLKGANPDLKVLISIGGWNEGGKKYSDMVTSSELRQKFVESALKFVEDNHFDGLDLSWEYPGASDRGGRSTDKENFAKLVMELSEKFKPKGLLLSSSVSPARFRINEGYDVPILNKYIDFFNVITYDLRGPWDGKADHNAPLQERTVDSWAYKNLNVKSGLNYWVEQGADKRKLIMGIPFYGRSYTLVDPESTKPGARIRHGGTEGEYTQEAGFLAYYEICSRISQGGWILKRDESGGPYIVKGDQWIGFDDPEYITKKMEFLRQEQFGGAMVWAIDLDDQLGICRTRWPLLSAVKKGLGYREGDTFTQEQMPGKEPMPEKQPMPEEKPIPEEMPMPEEKPMPKPEPSETKPESIEPPPSTRDTTPSSVTGSESSSSGSSDSGSSSDSSKVDGAPCSNEGYTEAYPYDCASYLVCNHKKKMLVACSPDLHWNDAEKRCDWPKNAKCTASGSPPPSSGDSMGDGGSTPGSSSGSGSPMPHPTVELEKVTPSGQLNDDFMVVCYFTNWAWYRPGLGKYKPEDIDASLCTHIVYGFAVLDYSNLIIKPHDSWADLDNKFYEKVTALKAQGKKVTIAIGGWNDSAGDKYSRLVNSPSARRKFVEHVTQFIEKYNFDGLDLDWEYPKCWQVECKKGPESDKSAFVDWVRELSEAFKPRGWLLSAAVSPSKKVIDAGYDVAPLNRYFDWIAVMTYDYHGQWDKKTGHVAPMYHHPDDDIDYFNMDFTIRYWLKLGATKDKLVLGMPMYGQSFTLNDASVNGLNAPARSGGTAGEFTRAKGFLAYYEICHRIQTQGWQVVKDPLNRMGPYAYKGNQWVSFDDVETIRLKSEYVKEMNLRGAMIWALDLDDFRNRCGQGAHPLLNTIKSVLGTSRGSGIGGQGPSASSEPTSGTIGSKPSGGTQPVDSPPRVVEVQDSGIQTRPPPDPPSTTDDEYKVVCYFTNWAWYRQGEGKYVPEDIDETLCTHIVYGFAVLNPSSLTIKFHDKWADIDNNFFERVVLKKSGKRKVLLAIGGWNDSRGDKYSKLVNNPSARKKFNEHVLQFILKYNFDGLDLDWEYPKCWQVDCKKGPESDKPAFSAWIKELYELFQPHGLLLSAAVSPSNKVVDAGYEVPMLSRYLDWIAVMTYDYHGQWDKKTGHVAPMYMHPMDDNPFFNTNYTIHYWIEKGADRKKIVMGMPMYGQSFTLSQSRDNTLNQKTYGGGEAGPYTRARGFLAYYEICYFIKNSGWTVVKDEYKTMGPYAYKGNQWVGFDDIDVIRYKSEYIKHMGLGGGMIWALDLDDFRNRCGCEQYPLLKTINRVLRGTHMPDPGCPVLGGGSGTELLPFGSEPHERITTTPTPTTLPPWMTTRKTTWWNQTPSTTTMAPKTTTRKPYRPPVATEATTTTRPPWKPDDTTRSPGGRCGIGEFKPHPKDCKLFYQCTNGEWVQRKCTFGLYWDVDRCKPQSDARCTMSQDGTMTPMPQPAPPKVAEKPFMPESSGTDSRPPPVPKPLPSPPSSAPDSEYKVVCYFTNWAWYRQGIGKYKPADIDPSLCSHIVYGFAVLDNSRLLIKPHDTWADFDNKFYEQVTALKKHGVKVLIAIGGWNDSLGPKYSKLVNDPAARRRFTEHVLDFVLKHNFDGLDLDWEYPKCWQVDCKKGPDSDKTAFSAWIKELYEAFQPHGLLLSAAVSPSYKVIDAGYEVPQLSRYLDWIAVMTYDYHGHWDKKTGHVAPMYHHSESTVPEFNANYTIHYWIEHGADRKKIIMGMPMYGQAFSLASATDNGLNAKISGKGQAGQFTRAAGFLAYYEICHKVLNEGYTVVRDDTRAIGPYAYKGNQWFGYDDIATIRHKSEYIKHMGLGGGMIWALDLDDFRNRCGCEEHPLLRTINRVLRGYSVPDPGCKL